METCGVVGENPWGCLRKLVELFVIPFRLKRMFACVNCYLTDVKCHFTDAETYVSRVEVYCLGDVFPFLPSRFHLSLFPTEKQVDRVKDEASRPVHRSFPDNPNSQNQNYVIIKE